MKRYLRTVSRNEAKKIILENTESVIDEEYIPACLASGRLTSRPVYAKISSPSHILSAMDGYAVDSLRTRNADVSNPLQIKKFEDAYPLNTGEPLPHGCDAVIMVEETEEGENSIIIRKPANLWQNVRMVGEDTIEGELLLPKYHRISTFDIAVLLTSGVTHVHVFRKPRILLIPTGRELIDPYDEIEKIGKRGYIIDFNSYVLTLLGESEGLEVRKANIARNKDEIEHILDEHLDDVDACIINAGTSAGSEDFTDQIIRKKGEVLFHGVSMMPGKPFLFGKIRGKPIFGIPGYPVSAILCFKEFVVPFCEKLTGRIRDENSLMVKTAYKIPSRMGVEEFVRVNLIKKGHNFYAIPLPRGASIVSSLATADGIIKVPENLEGYDEDMDVVCELIKERRYLENRINIVGSHDICLSVLREILKNVNPKLDLISIHTGSLGGIMAFRKGITDLTTTHILDPDEKIYNIPILKNYLGAKRWKLINIAKRITGIAVRKGNPKNIKKIDDVAKPGIKFINRQYGSGTRILFDMLIQEKGIEKEKIDGYDREEASHMRVGVLIKEGIADCGITIYSVAKLFDLGFIPLAEEDFDLLVSDEFTKEEKFQLIYDIITSDDFKSRLQMLGGYETTDTGKIKYVNG
ncbi:MAG: molybdopterin biosynthesis protein [Deltaproteobacteria bacterium]|nr:molybdopterin biosynthesis protein [Deltaproteobacteria bacterium]